MSKTSSVSLPRVELRGIERFTIWTPEVSFKVVHTMQVQGSASSVDSFLSRVAEAWMCTFNRHPRMRLRLLKNEFAVGEIHPKLTLEDIHDQKLLRVTVVSSASEMSDSVWQAYVQEQAEVPFDRVESFGFELHVWADKTSGSARLFLFSDHYVSDGQSGNTILHDVLSIASSLASGGRDLVDLTKEVALCGSIYDQMFGSRTFVRPLLRNVIGFFGKKLVSLAPLFTPVIKPRAGHHAFQVPPVANASTLLFATGSSENMAKLLARCRQEKTTFFGALIASVVVGYAVVTKAPLDKKMELSTSIAYGMRTRMAEPVAPETVGFYALSIALEKFMQGSGLSLVEARFWDIARAAKQEADGFQNSFAATALPVMVLDQFYHSEMPPAFFDGIPNAEFCSVSDVSVSSVGRYPHKTAHLFPRNGASDGDDELTIESLHFNCRTSLFAALSQFYVTSLPSGGISYGFNHHLEPEMGKQVLAVVVAATERAWRVDSADSMAEVVRNLQAEKQLTPELKTEVARGA